MNGKGSKQKGAQFEREVCGHLSRWITKGKSDSCFWRSAMSGGRATVRHAKGKSVDGQGGDITATDPRAHALLSKFVIECKHVKDLNLRSAAINGVGSLFDHWNQVALDAARANKQPMLIARQNRFPTLLFLRVVPVREYFGFASKFECARFFKLEGARVSMFLFEDFLQGMPYERDRFR